MGSCGQAPGPRARWSPGYPELAVRPAWQGGGPGPWLSTPCAGQASGNSMCGCRRTRRAGEAAKARGSWGQLGGGAGLPRGRCGGRRSWAAGPGPVLLPPAAQGLPVAAFSSPAEPELRPVGLPLWGGGCFQAPVPPCPVLPAGLRPLPPSSRERPQLLVPALWPHLRYPLARCLFRARSRRLGGPWTRLPGGRSPTSPGHSGPPSGPVTSLTAWPPSTVTLQPPQLDAVSKCRLVTPTPTCFSLPPPSASLLSRGHPSGTPAPSPASPQSCLCRMAPLPRVGGRRHLLQNVIEGLRGCVCGPLDQPLPQPWGWGSGLGACAPLILL